MERKTPVSQSLFNMKLQTWTPTQRLQYRYFTDNIAKYCEIFKNNFFYRAPLMAVSDSNLVLTLFMPFCSTSKCLCRTFSMLLFNAIKMLSFRDRWWPAVNEVGSKNLTKLSSGMRGGLSIWSWQAILLCHPPVWMFWLYEDWGWRNEGKVSTNTWCNVTPINGNNVDGSSLISEANDGIFETSSKTIVK